MIATRSRDDLFRTMVTNGRLHIESDAAREGRGGGGGLRPHELLEAALAACMNISVRHQADALRLGPIEVRTSVQLDRSRPGDASYRWDANDYHRSASAQTGWGREVHDRLALRGDEHVVDLGCGDGRLTAELAARLPHGTVTGIDADPDMVRFAREHHARDNVEFVLGDARRFSLGRRAALIVSTAALHWVEDHQAVLRRCRAHLHPGGRIHFQMGGLGNCAGILAAAGSVAAEPRWAGHVLPFSTPWHFQGPEAYLGLLPACGFRPLRAELLAKDMVHDGPDGLRGWLRTTWMPVLSRVPEGLRAELVEAIAGAYLARRPPDAQGRTHVDMVRFEVEAAAVADST